jgi:hypothetical protein
VLSRGRGNGGQETEGERWPGQPIMPTQSTTQPD